MVVLKEAPQGFHLGIHPVRRGDDEDREVEDGERPLHLRGEVRVAGRVEEVVGSFISRKGRPRELGLLRVDRDAPGALNLVRVKECIALIDPPELSDGRGAVEQALGERGLPGVNVGQNTQRDILFVVFICKIHILKILFLHFNESA